MFRAPAAAPMLAEFNRNLPDLALLRGQQRAILGSVFHFIGRPRLREALLQVFESIGPHCTPLTTQNHESNRPIEPWYLELGERPRDLLGQAKTGHANALSVALLDVVVDLDFPIANHYL